MQRRSFWMMGIVTGVIFLFGLVSAFTTYTYAQISSDIKINEFFPNPPGASEAAFEFIELINIGSSSVDISGWRIDDVDGNSDGPYAIPAGTTLAAGGIIHFLGTTTGVTLNNTNDSVRLIDGAGSVVQVFTYSSTTEGKSYNRSGDTFVLADPTPGQPNTGGAVTHAPVAHLTGPTNGNVGQVLNFSGSGSTDADGDVLTYEWDFGDGGVESGVTAAHTYTAAGTFTVTLKVTDSGGLIHSVTQGIAVAAVIYSDALVINEFLPNPTGTDAGNEFIELYNPGSVAIDLTGWKLDDADGAGTSSPFSLSSGTTIAPGAYVAFFTSVTLNNDADSVRLLAPDAAVKAHTSYTSSIEGQSHNRLGDGTYVLSPTLTPNAVNIVPVIQSELGVQTYSDAVKINEFLPDPEGSDSDLEFIELVNTGSDEVSLGGWKLDDGDGGSSPFSIPTGTKLAGSGIIHFLSSQTKISLGNSGDTVRLLDPAGAVKHTTRYEESDEGVSFNRVDSSFVQSTTVTPGAANVITSLPEKTSSRSSNSSSGKSTSGKVAGATSSPTPISTTLENVKKLPDGTLVSVEGTVSVTTGLFGNNTSYLSGSGIQLYASKGLPSLVVEQVINVIGKLSTSGGERRILVAKTGDITKTGKTSEVEVHELPTGDVGEVWEGSVVSIAGAVTQTSGSTFSIDDGSGEVRIFIRDTTGIVKPRITKGTYVAVIGIVSQTTSGYRVMPRTQADVEFGATAKIKRSVSAAPKKSVGKIDEVAATITCPPAPSATEEMVCTQPTSPNFLLSNSLVFLGCMMATGLMVSGVRAGEPLLALTSKSRYYTRTL
jgi:PKD repeat protein